MAQSTRNKRRILGMLAKRLDDARLSEVSDGRDLRGRRWKLETLLSSVLLGHVSGSRSLKEVEWLTDELPAEVRRRPGIPRRVPDTTLRDALSRLSPEELRPSLHAVTHAARRRKALSPDGLPFGVIALDGKGTAVPAADDFFAQRQTAAEDGPLVGFVRTVTVALTSSLVRPVVDVVSIPASTNEMGVFGRVLDQVMAAYSKSELFRLVTYDAGACSLDNARAVRKHGLHYLLGLKGTQPTLHEDAKLWLGVRGAQQADAVSEDLDHGNVVVRRLYLGKAVAAPERWEHLRTVARVEVETFDTKGNRISREDRYFVSSLPRSRLTDEQWLLLVRRHWGVETAHQILDGAFDEDKHPWIEQHPRATAVVMVLRRIAYTLLVLWRDVTLRSDDNRSRPWSWIMRDIFLCLLTATADCLRNQRSMPLLR